MLHFLLDLLGERLQRHGHGTFAFQKFSTAFKTEYTFDTHFETQDSSYYERNDKSGKILVTSVLIRYGLTY